MNQPTSSLFGQQLEALRRNLRESWSWPSPQAGMALHVFDIVGQSIPINGFSPNAETDFRRIDQAPVLAAYGYTAVSKSITYRMDTSAWLGGLTRLSSREAFPHDRESFVYRPAELLGIALGTSKCASAESASLEWLRNVLTECEGRLTSYDLWHRLLASLAASLLNIRWNAPEVRSPLNQLGLEDLALLNWLRTSYPSYAESLKLDISGLDSLLLETAATRMYHGDGLDQAAVMLCALEGAVKSLFRSPDEIPVTSEQAFLGGFSQLKGSVDVAIITVREDEHAAVLRRFPKAFIYRGQNRSYAMCRFVLPDGTSYRIAVVKSIEQGEGSGQDVARDVIEDLDPQWIMLVGIAGGVPADEFTLGDVVVALRLVDFSVRASLESQSTQYATTGGPMHRQIQDRLSILGAMSDELAGWNDLDSVGLPRPPVAKRSTSFYGDDVWKQRAKQSIARHFGRGVPTRGPIVTSGAIASSDALVKSTATLKEWQSAARQLIAVEMELGGVYQAAHRMTGDYPVLAIRGISDIVGFKRHADWTSYACQTAAAFAHAFLLTKPIEPRSP